MQQQKKLESLTAKFGAQISTKYKIRQYEFLCVCKK